MDQIPNVRSKVSLATITHFEENGTENYRIENRVVKQGDY